MKKYNIGGKKVLVHEGELFVQAEPFDETDLGVTTATPKNDEVFTLPKKRKYKKREPKPDTKKEWKKGNAKARVPDGVIITIKNKVDRNIKAGNKANVAELCKEFGITNPTYYSRVKKLDGNEPVIKEEKHSMEPENPLEGPRPTYTYTCIDDICGFIFDSKMSAEHTKCPKCGGPVVTD